MLQTVLFLYRPWFTHCSGPAHSPFRFYLLIFYLFFFVVGFSCWGGWGFDICTGFPWSRLLLHERFLLWVLSTGQTLLRIYTDCPRYVITDSRHSRQFKIKNSSGQWTQDAQAFPLQNNYTNNDMKPLIIRLLAVANRPWMLQTMGIRTIHATAAKCFRWRTNSPQVYSRLHKPPHHFQMTDEEIY